MKEKKKTNIKDLYPSLSKKDQKEAAFNIKEYVITIAQILKQQSKEEISKLIKN